MGPSDALNARVKAVHETSKAFHMRKNKQLHNLIWMFCANFKVFFRPYAKDLDVPVFEYEYLVI